METKLATEMIFGIVGGLGIFLLGMKNMSEGMQAVAGDRIRKLINAVTNNRLIACGVGTMVTCLIQSSSVTTVMVVGMVNASIMNLSQAIGVILGANIGTTITGWILVLKISKYGLPLLGVGAFFYLFSKRDRVRYTASFFLGLGMVFFGLQLMKNGFAPIKEMPEFVEWFSRFTPDSYLGVIKCCLVGAILTAIVQSSSATLGITMSLAFTGVIDFRTAAALVLGENIGTTITALLASLGTTTNAKRAAYAHMIINVIGVIWITLIFHWYIQGIEGFVGNDPSTPVPTDTGVTTYPHALPAIAATHTGFNVMNVLLFIPFTAFLSKLLQRLVPDKKHKEISHLTYIDVRMLDTPAIGMQQSQKELVRMGEMCTKMTGILGDIMFGQTTDKKKKDAIFNREKILDHIQKEIVEFLSNIMAGNITHDLIDQGRRQLRMADEYESISDYITNILKLHLKMIQSNQVVSEQGRVELQGLHNLLSDYLKMINEAVKLENSDILTKAQTQSQSITHTIKSYRTNHLARVGTGTTTPMKSLIYTDMLTSYRRIKDHTLNIAEAQAGEK